MKTLVVYFSRTGNTQALAEQIAHACSADLEDIQEGRYHLGAFGYLRALADATRHQEVPIRPSEFDPADYDLVAVGTPIWAWNMASPVRSYLTRHRGLFRNLALFCTYSGAGESKVFSEMQTQCDRHATARLAVRTRDFHHDLYQLQLAHFLEELKTAAVASRPRRNPRGNMATAPLH
jgi:menaquinone-dependent protoporphyrinogen IX oxidase